MPVGFQNRAVANDAPVNPATVSNLNIATKHAFDDLTPCADLATVHEQRPFKLGFMTNHAR